MREEPSLDELLQSVTDFLRDELMPALDGRLAFHARVAANVLDICRREVNTGRGAEERERQRLAKLLNQLDDTRGLNRTLCARIRNGDFAHDEPELVRHLWATTLDTLAIDQPRYATYRRALEFTTGGKNGED